MGARHQECNLTVVSQAEGKGRRARPVIAMLTTLQKARVSSTPRIQEHLLLLQRIPFNSKFQGALLPPGHTYFAHANEILIADKTVQSRSDPLESVFQECQLKCVTIAEQVLLLFLLFIFLRCYYVAHCLGWSWSFCFESSGISLPNSLDYTV